MNFIQKFLNNLTRTKGISPGTPGFSLLSKLVPSEMGTSEMLMQYKKSLYVFACISKIAEKVGSIDISVKQILNSKGDTKELVSHPALDLIYRPNKIQTKSEFLMTTIINKKSCGDAFWYKVRNDRGQVVELWNLRPDLVTIVTDPEKVVAGYKLMRADGSELFIEAEDVVHFKDYPDPTNQYVGVSALMPARIRVQTEEFATNYQRQFFLNSARPDAVLKSPKKVTGKQKNEIRNSWNKRHRGVSNSAKIAILEGGMEYQLISLTQKDMDYIEGIKMTRDDILVAFRMTKTVLGITEDVNRANAEAAMYVFLSEVIQPEMKYIMEKANEELMYVDFGENYEFTHKDPTPANRQQQLDEYTNGTDNHWLLINEIRQRENLEPVAGGWSFYMPLSSVAMGGLNPKQQKEYMDMVMKDSKGNERRIIEAKKPKLYDFRGRDMFRQKLIVTEAFVKSILKKSKKRKKAKGDRMALLKTYDEKKLYADIINKKIDKKSDVLKKAMDQFADEQERRVLKRLKKVAKAKKFSISSIFNVDKEEKLATAMIIPYIEDFLKEAGKESLLMIEPQTDFTNSARISSYIKKRSKFFADSINKTTFDKLEKTLAEGIEAGEGINDLSDRVKGVYDEFGDYRSELIARTEATAANNEGIMESFKQSSVINGKEWITAGDDRVRAEHMAIDGEIVGLEDNFSNGVPYPQEPNCRCVLGAAFIE